ncbi:MAG: AAA family ATPase [bacterium]
MGKTKSDKMNVATPARAAMCYHAAAALKRHEAERDPFKRAHRMLDAFEVAVKYAVAVTLFAALDRETEPARNRALLDIFAGSILRPSLGHWAGYLRQLLKPRQPAAWAVLADESFAGAAAAFGRAQADLDRLVALRNDYAHGATKADKKCDADLRESEPRLARVMAALTPLFALPLYAPRAGGDPRVLYLWRGDDIAAILAAPAGAAPPKGTDDAPPFVDLGGGRWVSLHPLLYVAAPAGAELDPPSTCVYNSVKSVKYADARPSQVNFDLLHYDSGDHVPVEAGGAPRFLVEFVKPDADGGELSRFQQAAYLAYFVGRGPELEEMRRFVEETQSGYLMVWGSPGAGKGALLSKFAEMMRGGAEDAESGGAEDGEDEGKNGDECAAESATASEADRPAAAARRVLVEMVEPRDSDPTTFLKRLCYRLADETGFKAAGDANDAGKLAERLVTLLHKASETGRRIVLVIDGLDEPLRSDGGSSGALLNYLPRHAPPGGCHIVLSSRPLGRVRSYWEGEQGVKRQSHCWREIELPGFEREDVDAYLMERLNKYAVIDHPRFCDAVFERSKGPDGRRGNPLYMRLVANAVQERELGFDEPDKVPRDLGELYERLLARLCGGDAAGRDAGRTLALVALARRAVTPRLAAKALGMDEGDVERAFERLMELLQEDRETPDVNDYSVFHKSLSEHVLREGRREDLEAARDGLLGFCRRWREWAAEERTEAADPSRVEGGERAKARSLAVYALAHYADHLEEELVRPVSGRVPGRLRGDMIAAALATPGDAGRKAARLAGELVRTMEDEEFRTASYRYCGSAAAVQRGLEAAQHIVMTRAGDAPDAGGELARVARYALWHADERPRKMRELVGEGARAAEAGNWRRALELAGFADTPRSRLLRAMLATVCLRGTISAAQMREARKVFGERADIWLRREPTEMREAWDAVMQRCFDAG